MLKTHCSDEYLDVLIYADLLINSFFKNISAVLFGWQKKKMKNQKRMKIVNINQCNLLIDKSE